jgi:hypothetical protein
MKTQLFFDLTAETSCPSIHFQDAGEVKETVEELQRQNIAASRLTALRFLQWKGFSKRSQRP